jgi:hypothetical protein
MSSQRSVREEFVEPVRRALRWLASLRDGEGRIVCPEHQVEHTGKSAGAIVMACELLRLDPARDERWLLDVALSQARRLVLNLQREGESACHTFRPGFHDPFNCSNNVIDGGACSDALAHLVTVLGDRLEASEREAFRAASLLHARTYLRYAVLDKGVPAQRAWGLTGIAGAWALEHDATLEDAAIQAVGALEGIQHPDGSYAYHPLEWGAEHPGSSDVSAFYQSRVTGFLMYALQRMGRDARDPIFAGPLARGLDFLTALQAPDGVKCGLVEAKPWYWGAEHEVASHPFDVYALSRGWQLFGRAQHAEAALRAFGAWRDYLKDSGEPTSHRAGPGRGKSYQCPVFWAAHAAWMARSLESLEAMSALSVPDSAARGASSQENSTVHGERRRASLDLAVRWFPNAQLGRIEDGAVIAWIRGARPAVNQNHGSPRGAGLVRVWSKKRARDILARGPGDAPDEAEWSGSSGSTSLARGWRANHAELRFSLWLSRVAWRGGRVGDALLGPIRAARRGLVDFGSSRVSSACDLVPEVEVHGDGIHVRGDLAHPDGSRIAGATFQRSFTIDGDGLCVDERLLDPGSVRHVTYRVPDGATDVVRTATTASYRLA